MTFFVGSILFTGGGALQTWLAFPGRHAPGAGRAGWWAAAIQSAGTLFFNVTTFQALSTRRSSNPTTTASCGGPTLSGRCASWSRA